MNKKAKGSNSLPSYLCLQDTGLYYNCERITELLFMPLLRIRCLNGSPTVDPLFYRIIPIIEILFVYLQDYQNR